MSKQIGRECEVGSAEYSVIEEKKEVSPSGSLIKAPIYLATSAKSKSIHEVA
jgi:hypothetical protein